MITIYGSPICGWCIRSKNLAERYNLTYTWKDINEDPILKELHTLLPGASAIPQIWWHDRHIGGYEEFAAEIENTVGGHGDQKF